MSKEMVTALANLEKEKGIKQSVVIEALEAALVSAYKRNYGQAQNVEVEFNERKGDIHVYAVKKVVEEVEDDQLQVSLADALQINRAYELDDEIRFEVTPKNFGRIAAQTAKQVIMQRVREAEREVIYEKYSQYLDEMVTGEVARRDNRYVYVDLGGVEAVMSKQDQIPGEQYEPHDHIKVYVTKVEYSGRGPQIFVSRSHEGLLKRLFEQEIPEIYDGTVEIMSVAREAGDRAKVAVRSNNPDIDAVGTCVGPRGQRIQTIVNELHGENMDVIEWEDDDAEFISNALNPAEVIDVLFNEEEENSCIVIVPDYQLSLAIGKRGQNARLAAKLTNYKIDIKSETDAAEFVEEDDEEEEVADSATGVESTADESTVDENVLESESNDDSDEE
ncbi:transcription termination/antitermination protein NusA [Pediococcus acidilactici]|uniref:transcription termination factor NusA n=1 Tax=Pediococcus acidilactici TaxID=1254 RepID=UPI0013287648|nr:transcription termination factor NusA [Pediococcus acidilactici]KAF0335505.1 transcription termination/antitermination protein NusA [Pediococcus acidilactici]KAF0336234.1 transcription termination/antitermination protein NusA [Pediococcus acidilactici]KAF0338526.1 transcription termination/antitermination protein NusA [Pediococcus acidilactici]KAF0341000.1 transcription termination/antitermination protein NusA [Pediococcus acidilactici]KAF0346018.1 transcription termination/antitermination 